jgi:UDP-N-acetylglucosamine 2-epimerase (non-hydrolysing)
MKRLLVIAGTRPEAIKLAPVIRAFDAHAEALDVRLALTGQHSDMVDQVLEIFGLTAGWNLEIMREGQDLYDVARGCLDGLRSVVSSFRPDLVLVQGDTASVVFGALVAFFERVPVGHVEAGLRTGNKWQPYPEESFRRMTAAVADLHFAPTKDARANLLREGVPEEDVFLTGNTVVDALGIIGRVQREISDPHLARAISEARPLVLVTAHRRESFGAPLGEVFSAVRQLADAHPDHRFLYPVHPNPNVSGPAHEMLSGHPGIQLTQPLSYLDLIRALQASSLVLTDSGGIQEEAPTFGTHVLVLREVTERPEGVRAGAATLVGTDRDRIILEAEKVLGRAPGQITRSGGNPYGDGLASARIADIVSSTLLGGERTTRDWDG